MGTGGAKSRAKTKEDELTSITQCSRFSLQVICHQGPVVQFNDAGVLLDWRRVVFNMTWSRQRAEEVDHIVAFFRVSKCDTQ